MNDWQPISTAQKNGGSILIGQFSGESDEFDELQEWRVAFWDDRKGGYSWHIDGTESLLHESWPTHWMPLPEPPSGRIVPEVTMLGSDWGD